MQVKQHVDVILYSAYAVQGAIMVLHYSPDVTVHLFAALHGDGHLAAIGVDDDMVDGIDGTHDDG